MFNLKDAYREITLDDIFSKVSEYELWKYYCTNFDILDKPFLSELYKDNNPSCRIFQGNNNRLIYKDFGDNGKTYTILDYIQAKYFCSFKECLSIIANDFHLTNSNISLNKEPIIIPLNDEPKIKYKSNIDIVEQGYTFTDYKYWNQYEIPLTLVESEEILSCKSVYLTTRKGVFRYDYSNTNPIYAFKEYDIDLNFLGYKIYFPNAQKGSKWLNNSSDRAIQGIKTLRYDVDLIGLAKSRKDNLCYKLLGIQTIAPYNESSNLKISGINTIMDKFPRKFVNFDPDETGLTASEEIYSEYGYNYFFIDKCKDLSDYIKKYGLDKAKQMINKQIKQL